METIITVFGSAEVTSGDPLYAASERIGKLLAENGYVVCCGGYGGTMEAVCRGAKSADGRTIGVTIDYPGSVPNDYVDENVVMPNWVERLMELIAIGDAYIILRGGSGTLAEISALIEMMNKKIMKQKQLVFYGDFWKEVIETLKQDSQNLKDIINANVRFAGEVTEVIEMLNSLKFWKTK